MPNVMVRWRPSGGRGEYEFVPSTVLAGKHILLSVPEFDVIIETDVSGTISQGKPRLRKAHPNDRRKLHLVPLVMAVARLPAPAREDKLGKVAWPLENKAFIVSQMDFEVVDSDASTATLRPIAAQILHSTRGIDLKRRFKALAEDIEEAASIGATEPNLASAIQKHAAAVKAGKLDSDVIQKAADAAVSIQTGVFGKSNAAAISSISKLPHTPLEDDISGKEGKILTRLHSYRERDRKLVKDAKAAFKDKHGALVCECCGYNPEVFYGERGEGRIQAHHRTPLEELMPDTITKFADLAMVCPNCHDIIHAKRPWITVDALRTLIEKHKVPT